MSYSQKLKDPRWQKKRLEILERDGWACRICDEGKTTLHVHHLQYHKGKDPWESEDHDLLTMCEYCHKDTHDGKYSETCSLCGDTLDPKSDTVCCLCFNDMHTSRDLSEQKLLEKLSKYAPHNTYIDTLTSVVGIVGYTTPLMIQQLFLYLIAPEEYKQEYLADLLDSLNQPREE